MKPINKNILLILRILLPAICCFVFLQFFSVFFTDYTYATLMVFGFIIVLFNYNKVKHNYFVSFVISIVLSYLTFFVSIAFTFGITYVLMQFIELEKINTATFLGFIINIIKLIPAVLLPLLLMFYTYNILFKIKKNTWYKIVKLCSIMLLIIYGLISKQLETNYFIVWQVIMALSLQLILYQDEIKSLFKK